MDDLPELPFLKVLSYLSLEDRLRVSAVSRSCHEKVANSRVKSLCYSSRPSDFILGKNRLVTGAFAQNFISSTRFAPFFDTFGQTILSSLKRLRLCDLDLSGRNGTAFARTLNSFIKLEQLDIIRAGLNQQDVLNLNLPMLTSLHLEYVHGAKNLALEAPRLREITILDCFHLRLEIVHGESVERLLIKQLKCIKVSKLKNLQFLYVKCLQGIDSTFLSSLQQLKEFHKNNPEDVSELFEQKQRYDRADLKIYLCGLLLNGPHDPAINSFRDSSYLRRESLVCLEENWSRLADEIPFYSSLHYSHIERVASGLEVDLLKRFIHLTGVTITRPVQDIRRFLNLLKNCENISELSFACDQPQDLFDLLPEHCAVQKLALYRPPSDLAFLFRLKHLIHLYVGWSINNKTVRRAFDELPVLSSFVFQYCQKSASIQIDYRKQFPVSVDYKKATFPNLNAAIEFIFGKNPSRPKKRKAEALN